MPSVITVNFIGGGGCWVQVTDVSSLIQYFKTIENPTANDQEMLYQIVAGQFRSKWELDGESIVMSGLRYSYELSTSLQETKMKGDVARLLSFKRCDDAKHVIREISAVHEEFYISIEVPEDEEYDKKRKENGTFYVKQRKAKKTASTDQVSIAFHIL
jgi:hypothetical protein